MDQKVVLLQIQGIISIINNTWVDDGYFAFYTTMWNGRDQDTCITIYDDRHLNNELDNYLFEHFIR